MNKEQIKNQSKQRNEIIKRLKKAEVNANSASLKLFDIQNKRKDMKKTISLVMDQSSLEKKEKSIEKKISTLESKITKAKEKNSTKEEIHSYKIEISMLSNDLKKIRNKITRAKKANIEKLENKLAKLKETEKAYSKIKKEKVSVVDEILRELNVIDKDLENHNIDSDKSFVIKDLNVYYGKKQALFNINLDLPKNSVIALIGPSGCGKSTLLRTLNRINDEVPIFRAEGQILLDGKYDIYKQQNIYNPLEKISITELRTKVGMIFQQPNPFPMSIRKNITYGPRINGVKSEPILDRLVVKSLKQAALYEDVKSNLNAMGTALSGGQQQRLCIARAIANKPEILLMDEPTSALDPIAAAQIEELILELKKKYTIIIVTHSMQQAQRVSDYTAFMYKGDLIEYGTTKQIFNKPKKKETKEYLSGKFG